MEPTDLTIHILQEIRDDIRGLREEQEAFRADQHAFRLEQTEFNRAALARFEVIESALRDFAQQLVILGRGVKVLIEGRGDVTGRLDDHERRIAELEKQRA